jgi:hypothetical protein
MGALNNRQLVFTAVVIIYLAPVACEMPLEKNAGARPCFL